MPGSIDEIRYYGNLVVELEKSTDKDKGALEYFKAKLDEAIRKYVRRENVA